MPSSATLGAGRYLCAAALLCSLAAQAATDRLDPDLRWWPVQQPPKAIVRTELSAMAEVAEPNGRSPNLWLGQEHMLVTAVAGLAAQAVNETRGDELVWIEARSPDYQIWYESMTNRLRLRERGSFKPWELVKRFADRGIVKGYILYTYDFSEGGATRLRPGSDESLNVATTLAGLLGAVPVSEGQEPQAREAGLKMLADARGKTEAWCFEKYRDQLNRRCALVQDPQIPHARDIAIAHRMMTLFGTNSPTLEVYAWLEPLSSVLGWNGGEEAVAVQPMSRAGHTLLACNWSMNLCALSAGSQLWDAGGRFQPFDPRAIDFNDGKSAVSFIMSDGDNVQWMMGSFCTHRDYWASVDHGAFPIGWGAAIGSLDQCSPDTLAYLKRTQRPNSTLNLHAGGYFYPDLLGTDRTPEIRRRILADHARRVSHYLRRSGSRTLQFITMDIDSPAALEAYGIFASEIENLAGMFALQYYPYEGGEGRVFWVPNRHGEQIPVVTAKYRIWEKVAAKNLRAGAPAKVAQAINEDARAAVANNIVLNAWCVTHTWSGFANAREEQQTASDASANPREVRAVTPTRWCVDLLGSSVKVVSPEELLWRIRMRHAPRETARLMERAFRGDAPSPGSPAGDSE